MTIEEGELKDWDDRFPGRSGDKHDQDKPMWHLMPPLAEAAVVDVLPYGANKYAPHGWKEVPNLEERYYSAMRRHIHAYHTGQDYDPESGLHHLAHAACNLMFVLQHALDEADKELPAMLQEQAE